jgi:phospholipase D1/2
MTPGIALLIAVGSRLDALLRDPSLAQILQLGLAVLLWFAAGYGLQSFARWLEKGLMRSQAD